jgi:DNA mismatch repair protein MutS2
MFMLLMAQEIEAFTPTFTGRTGVSGSHTGHGTTLFSGSTMRDNMNVNGEGASASAGKDGYSVLRQPVQWGSDNDSDTKTTTATTNKQQTTTPSWLKEGNSVSSVLKDLVYIPSKDGNDSGNNNGNENQKTRSRRDYDDETAIDDNDKDNIHHVNLYQRTRETLDYPRILTALRKLCTTVYGKELISRELYYEYDNDDGNGNDDGELEGVSDNNNDIIDNNNNIQQMRLTAMSVEGVQARYQAVSEMQRLTTDYVLQQRIKPMPLVSKLDLLSLLAPLSSWTNKKNHNQDNVKNNSNSKNNNNKNPKEYLEGEQIVELAAMLNELQHVSVWCQTLNKRAAMSEKREKSQSPQRRTYSSKDAKANKFSKTSDDYMNMNHDPRSGKKVSASAPSAPAPSSEQVPDLFRELPRLGQFIDIDADLRDTLNHALDDDFQLDGTTFSSIGRLRVKIKSMQTTILSTVNSLLQTPAMSAQLATESGGSMISEVNGRIVIPIDVTQYNNRGTNNNGNNNNQRMVVHDVSRSGKTYYCEPPDIIEDTNELRQAEMSLEAETIRIYKLLTAQILDHAHELEDAVAAAGQLDLVQARLRFGEMLVGGEDNNGHGVVIPQVKNEGVIQLREVKHPVLLLRQLDDRERQRQRGKGVGVGGLNAKGEESSEDNNNAVVGNDIDFGFDDQNQGLVLTGPNSGGKTVVLKILGLCALMVRDGIPLPAAMSNGGGGIGDGAALGTTTQPPQPARVDFFNPVLADIGDMQSVGGDLSTFSGHMLVCREVLAQTERAAQAAANGGGANKNGQTQEKTGHPLVLMDELGSGTDPAQGVAIAQALLEALVDQGARVAITTHYMELKQLAFSDSRFAVGGMQFLNGRPTYKLLAGTVGESFALSVAERLKLPPKVIARANELLDQDTRQMGDLLQELEDQKSLVEERLMKQAETQRNLDALQREMLQTQTRLEKEQLTARRSEAAKFAATLEQKELVMEQILTKLKNDPSRKVVAQSWNDIKYVKRDALNEAEFVPGTESSSSRQVAADSLQLIPVTELDVLPDLQPGDHVVVCKDSAAVRGKEALVTRATKKNVEVNVGNMPLRLKWSEVALPSSAMAHQLTLAAQEKALKQQAKQGTKVSKLARRALAEAASSNSSANSNGANSNSDGQNQQPKSVMRTASNTIDLRGNNLADSQVLCENFFSALSMQSQKNAVAYLLHGHGTGGVLKTKLREWLKRERQWVKRYQPADTSDGGDAFTKVELKPFKM